MAEMAQSSNNRIKYLCNINLPSTGEDIFSGSFYHKLYAKITFNSQSKSNASEGRVTAYKTCLP